MECTRTVVSVFLAAGFVLSPLSACAAFEHDLHYGTQSADIAALQQFLLEQGYYAGTIDGVYATTTQSALAAFQTQEGLSGKGDFFGPQARALTNLIIAGESTTTVTTFPTDFTLIEARAQIEDLASTTSALESRLTQAEASISDLQNAIFSLNSLQSEVDALTASVGDLAAQVASLQFAASLANTPPVKNQPAPAPATSTATASSSKTSTKTTTPAPAVSKSTTTTSTKH